MKIKKNDYIVRQYAEQVIMQIADVQLQSDLEKLLVEGKSCVLDALIKLRSKKAVTHLLMDFRRRADNPGAFAPFGAIIAPALELANMEFGAAPALIQWAIELQKLNPLTPANKSSIEWAEKRLSELKDTMICAICGDEKKVSYSQAARLRLKQSFQNAMISGSMKSTQLCFNCGSFFCNECLSQAFGEKVITEREYCPKCNGPSTFL